MAFNLFKKVKAEKTAAVDRFPEEPRDDFRSKEYYVGHLKRIEDWLAEVEEKVQDDPDARERSYIITEGHRDQRVRLLYVLRADEQEVRDAALSYLRNLQGLAHAHRVGERSELTWNLVYRALAFATLFDFEHEEVAFLEKDVIDDKYVDAAMDMLRSALFRGEASTDKDFYFKDMGYFGDVTKGTDGLLLAIWADGRRERTVEFMKYLKSVKEKHYKRLLKHYEEIGEQRYVYTGSYDFRLTAVAKVLGIDKDAVADSKFIAADLL